MTPDEVEMAQKLLGARRLLRKDLEVLDGLADYIEEWPEIVVKIRGHEFSIVTDSPDGRELLKFVRRVTEDALAGTESDLRKMGVEL